MATEQIVDIGSSIGGRLAAVLFFFYIVIVLMVTSVTMYLEYREVKLGILKELRMVQQAFESGIAEPLRELDEPGVHGIISGIVEISDVIGIKIEDDSRNRTFSAVGRIVDDNGEFVTVGADRQSVRVGGEESTSGLFWYRFPIIHEADNIKERAGDATIYSSSAVIWKKLLPEYRMLIIGAVIKAAGFWLIFLLLFRRMLTRPLSILTSAAEKIDPDNLPEIFIDVKGSGNNEFTILTNTFNGMVRKMISDRQALEKMNEDLRTIRENLEFEVCERTEAYRGANDQLTFEIEERKNIAGKLSAERAKAEASNRSLIEANRELTEMIERVKEMALKADIANITRSELLSDINHEIRTTMSSVMGMTELLQETALDPEQRRYVERIRGAGDELRDIINRSLAISFIEAGEFELDAGRFDPVRVIENSCEAMAAVAHRKGLAMICRIHKDVPPLVTGDSTRFKQVFTHLVENAVKFTRAGEIFIEVRVNSGDEKEVELLSSVKDTGVGIEKEKQEELFETISRGNAVFPRAFGGKGGGLPISKRFAEMMGGRIWVESEGGRGSCFYFTARFQVEKTGEETGEPARSLKGLKILIVEENDSTGNVISGMISEEGGEASIRRKGEGGLSALFNALDRGQPYDLVILGIPLPDMDEFKFLSIMRKNRVLQYAAVVTLSPVKEGDLLKSKELGVGKRLVKPVKRIELLAGINTALGREELKPVFPIPKGQDREHERMDAIEAPLPDPNPHGECRILLAEDTEDISNLILAFLKKSPVRIDVANNGAVAVEKFKEKKYDVVLMDIEMPVMDGLTATRNIRNWENENNLKPVSIVALTAHALGGYHEKSRDAGCNAHFVKPIKKKQLLSLIEEFSPVSS